MDKDYRMVRLIDGTTIMGSIVVDKDFLRITDALELNTVKRETEFGMKDDSTLAPWLPFTDDKIFVIPRDKIFCLLYTSPSPRDNLPSRMPSSA